jgi:hypothetical protein
MATSPARGRPAGPNEKAGCASTWATPKAQVIVRPHDPRQEYSWPPPLVNQENPYRELCAPANPPKPPPGTDSQDLEVLPLQVPLPSARDPRGTGACFPHREVGSETSRPCDHRSPQSHFGAHRAGYSALGAEKAPCTGVSLRLRSAEARCLSRKA